MMARPLSSKQLNITHLNEILEVLKASHFLERNWLTLGLKLGLLMDTLTTVEAQYGPDIGRCLKECLSLWLQRMDMVDERGGTTWYALATALSKIGDNVSAENARQKAQEVEKEREIFSAPVCQMLRKYSNRLSLPENIVKILYEEGVISKEMLDEVNRLGGVLGDGPLRALCTSVYKNPYILKVFASVLLKSEQTVSIAKDILKEYDQVFPLQISLHPTYQYDFDQMRVNFGNLIHKVAPLIEAGIPSLEELKTYLRRCFRELRPQLSVAKSFDDVMDLVQDTCTIINICCLEAIVDQYDITEAKHHIEKFKKAVDAFCEKVKLSICCNQNLKITSSSCHLIYETIEFVLEWEADNYTLNGIRGLLAKAFGNMAKSVQVRAIKEGNSIIVTCYAPHYILDNLLTVAKKNLDVLKAIGLTKLTISYQTIYKATENEIWQIKQMRENIEVAQESESGVIMTSRLRDIKRRSVSSEGMKWHNYNVVITGGCGFLGLHLARLLYQKVQGIHIMLFDKSPADEAAMNFITNGGYNEDRVSYSGRHNDITIPEHLNAAFQDADVVFHCAAIASSCAKIDFNKKMQRVNVEGTANVVKACQRQGVRALVFTGDLAQVLRSGLCVQEGITEDVIVRDHEELVMDHFGHSKTEAERKVLQANGFKTTLYTCSIRCPPLYGENDTTFLPNAFWAAERFCKHFPLVGHPSVKMTAMYVENAAWGHICAANKLLDENARLRVGGQFYYVTDDTPSESYSDFFKRFLKYLGYNVLPIRLPVLLLTCFTYLMVVLIVFLMAFFRYKSPSRVFNYRRQLKMLSTSHTVSRERARTELDYEPHVQFDEAFRKSSRWYNFNIGMLLDII